MDDRHGVSIAGRKSSNQSEFNPPGRPAPEKPDPEIVEGMEKLLTRLDNPSVPITRSPLEELRADVFGIPRFAAAGYFGPYSYSAWCAIEAGARETLPAAVGQTIKRIGGPGAAERFERVWCRWRKQIGQEAIDAAERKLFPAGPGFGMCE